MPQQDSDRSWTEDAVQVPPVPGEILVEPATGQRLRPTAPAGRSSASRCSCETATSASFATPTSASAEPPRSITSSSPRPVALVTSPTCEQSACGVMPAARADKERWPSNEPLGGGGNRDLRRPGRRIERVRPRWLRSARSRSRSPDSPTGETTSGPSRQSPLPQRRAGAPRRRI
jgi:hypothetical protein